MHECAIRVRYEVDHHGHCGRVFVSGNDQGARDDDRVDGISARGVEPASRETYGNAARKVIYRDPDGNEVPFGGAALE